MRIRVDVAAWILSALAAVGVIAAIVMGGCNATGCRVSDAERINQKMKELVARAYRKGYRDGYMDAQRAADETPYILREAENIRQRVGR